MGSFRLTFFLIVFLWAAIFDVFAIGCQKPVVNGQHVIGVDGKECVALVKEKCGALKSRGNTTTWIRGVKVRNSCSSIPSLTAIATFDGPGNTYNGGRFRHAAIFDYCDAQGIWAYDQWKDSPGVNHRRLAWTGTGSNGGDNFYTIV